MYKFIKKNQKIMMAVLGVGLMIVFILPTTFNRMGGQNPVVAKMGDVEMHFGDYRQAESDWRLLGQIATVSTDSGQPQIVPLPMLLGAYAVRQINEHPELYLILQREASNLGVQVGADQLETTLRTRIMGMDGTADIGASPQVRGAVARFLPVLNAYHRVGGAIKVSQPLLHQALARRYQSLRVDLVAFDAATPATAPAAPPSNDAIDTQFRAYADVTPGQPSAANPFGFGYRYPNQVKLQSIQVPFALVRDVVEKTQDPYDWKVEEYKYYNEHPAEFAPPATEPATTQPTNAASQPAVQPFEAVAESIHDKLVHQRATALMKRIQERLVGALGNDYALFARSPDATTRPANPFGAAYEEFAYLQKLADVIQKEFGVRPVIDQVAEFKGESDLAAIAQIGGATYKNVNFAQYAVGAAAAFQPENQKASAETLTLFKPSGVMRDAFQNLYVFRLTDARAAHAPANAGEARERIVADLLRKQSFDDAKSRAKALMQGAGAAGANLESAAKAAGLSVRSVGPVHAGAAIPEYPLDPAARAAFIDQAMDLLHLAAKNDSSHPMALIELPTVGKLAVVRLDTVEPVWNANTQLPIELQITQRWRDELMQVLQTQWFDFEAVKTRTGYEELSRQQRRAPQAPPPPMF